MAKVQQPNKKNSDELFEDANSVLSDAKAVQAVEKEMRKVISIPEGKGIAGYLRSVREGTGKDKKTGEPKTYKIYELEKIDGTTVLLGGATQLDLKLDGVPMDSHVFIARGRDEKTPNGFYAGTYSVHIRG